MLETVVAVLIGVSVAILIAELFFDPTSMAYRALRTVDRAILMLFAVELSLRVATVRPRGLSVVPSGGGRRIYLEVRARVLFLLRPLTLIDLLTVLTLYSGFRALRAVRLLRLLRSMRLFRYADPLRAITATARDNSLLFTVAFGFFWGSVGLGAVSIYIAEAGVPGSPYETFGDALWWALVTITTVGYGDLTPVTGVGRVIAGGVMTAGMFCLATFAGVVGHTLISHLIQIRKEQLRMSTRAGHIVVCGFDQRALPLLRSLAEEFPEEHHQLVLFRPEEPEFEVPDRFTFVPGDPTKQSELDKVRMSHARAVIVMGRHVGHTPGSADAVTLLTLFTIRAYLRSQAEQGGQRAIPLQLVAEILDPENGRHALASGADEVVETSQLGQSILAHTVRMPGTGTALGIVAQRAGQNLYVGSIPTDIVPRPATFGALVEELKRQHDVLVLGLRYAHTERIDLNPSNDAPVPDGVRVLYLGRDPFLGDDQGKRWRI